MELPYAGYLFTCAKSLSLLLLFHLCCWQRFANAFYIIALMLFRKHC